MHVLDWRAWAHRRLDATGVPAPAWLARLAGRFADQLAAGRVARRCPPAADALVVSIGNLRVGGTGKTPVTLALAEGLRAAGVGTGAILLRGHGSRTKAPLLVSAADPDAGDEARLLAANLGGGWRVLQARRRVEGLAALLDMPARPRVILLEDGHQTGGVGRHLDVLILDRWTIEAGVLTPRGGRVLPFGPYRETKRGAARASVWLVETDDWPGEQDVVTPDGTGTVLGFSRRHELVTCPGAAVATGAAWGVLSGVARPESVERAVGGLLEAPPVLAVRVDDHCRYDARLVRRVLDAGRRAKVGAWVTTAKDWVKLEALWPAEVPASLVLQRVQWRGSQALPQLVVGRLAALRAR